MRFLLLLALLIVSLHAKASCTDQLIDNVRYSDEFTVPYILTSQHQSPRYVLILILEVLVLSIRTSIMRVNCNLALLEIS